MYIGSIAARPNYGTAPRPECGTAGRADPQEARRDQRRGGPERAVAGSRLLLAVHLPSWTAALERGAVAEMRAARDAYQAAREIWVSIRTPNTAAGDADGERATGWPAAIAAATRTSST
jgi:hypothetical protein